MKDLANVHVVAGVVIKKNNKYLLIQEKQDKAYGLWNFPAGQAEVGDSIEQTAVKEAKEETGYDVKLLAKVLVFHDKIPLPVCHAFEAEIIGGELHIPEDEILDAQWFSYDEIMAMKDKLRGNWVIEAVTILESRDGKHKE